VLGHEVGHGTCRHAARSLGTAYSLEALSRLAMGNDPGTVAQLAAAIAAQGDMSRHSREAEREADARGRDYLIADGYEPNAEPAQSLRKLIRERKAAKGRTEIVGGFAEVQARLGKKSSSSSGSATPSKSNQQDSAPQPAPRPAR